MMDAKKGLLLVAMSLISVGVGLILIGMRDYQKLNDHYTNNYEEIAASKCKSDETFRVTKTVRGPRTYFNYFCDDAQGNTNNLIDEMSDEAPSFSDLKTTLAGAGVIVVAGVLASFAVPRPAKNRDGLS
ncbi:MAG: hypothetical protein F9K46_05915 [Anaerolineae bacterium]|nr:MAG: hypothetical protein F9K46_05915 [Anaerolineae bacterium]